MVYLIDDDPGIRHSLEWAFRASNIALRAFTSPQEFLAAPREGSASCLILDQRLEETTGVSFLQELRSQHHYLSPVILVTGTGDVATAVNAMKLGAVDYLEKPVDPTALIEIVRQSLAADEYRLRNADEREEICRRFKHLTSRERELVPLICSGLSNKQIAERLQLSIKTVINHRAKLIMKVQAANTADLVRMASMCPQMGDE